MPAKKNGRDKIKIEITRSTVRQALESSAPIEICLHSSADADKDFLEQNLFLRRVATRLASFSKDREQAIDWRRN